MPGFTLMPDLPAWDPRVFKRAGLSTRHLAPFFRVTRETVSLWLNERRQPHAELCLGDALTLQTAVQAALADSTLPYVTPLGMTRREADRKILRIIYNRLHETDEGRRLASFAVTDGAISLGGRDTTT